MGLVARDILDILCMSAARYLDKFHSESSRLHKQDTYPYSADIYSTSRYHCPLPMGGHRYDSPLLRPPWLSWHMVISSFLPYQSAI